MTTGALDTWLRMVPISFPATAMLGASVLQMVAITPILLFQRWRQKRKLLQVPLVMRDRADDDDLVEAVRGALAAIGLEDVKVAEATGPKSWPLRTVGFASRHLLGAVVRGEPMRLQTNELEISRLRHQRVDPGTQGGDLPGPCRHGARARVPQRVPHLERGVPGLRGRPAAHPSVGRWRCRLPCGRSSTRCRRGSTLPASTSRSGTSSIG